VQKVLQRCMQLMSSFTMSECSACMWSLARLSYLPPSPWREAVVERALAVVSKAGYFKLVLKDSTLQGKPILTRITW
jgi:hypothetical protein